MTRNKFTEVLHSLLITAQENTTFERYDYSVTKHFRICQTHPVFSFYLSSDQTIKQELALIQVRSIYINAFLDDIPEYHPFYCF